MSWDDLGRGLVAGMLENHISNRPSIVRRIGVALIVAGGLVAIAWGGEVRGLGITMVLVGLIAALTVGLVRLVALKTINDFARPTSIAEKREVIDRASESADLPRGPISITRFLVRVRRGVGPDVERLETVLDDLRNELARSEELAELTDAESRPELDGGATPELPE